MDMSIPTALALTGLAFLFVAAVVGTHASEANWRAKEKEVPIAWATFSISIALFLTAIWTEILL